MVDPGTYPLVVDDGGIPLNLGSAELGPYKNILALAQETNTAIPIAVTAGFVDLHRLQAKVQPNLESEQIVALLRDHADLLPVWNHGLTHTFRGHPTEFLIYDASPVPEAVQAEHLERSQAVFESVGLGAPEVFVPPGHAWQQDVTDRLAAAFGLKAIAIREFEKTRPKVWISHPWRRYTMTWRPSSRLASLYRLGLGIPAHKRTLNRRDFARAQRYMSASTLSARLLVHRRLKPPTCPHHFFAHLANFADPSIQPQWLLLIDQLKRQIKNNLSHEA